jgi:nucleotide-binding universal stress UspA family protein
MPTLAPVARLSLKTILFPTDFSTASRAALPFAETLARIYGSTILVAHALPPEPHGQVVFDRVPAQDDHAWNEAKQKLDELTHPADLRAIPCKPLLDRGDVVDVIPQMILDKHVDLIVLGTHGRRGVGKMILGSAAEKIYRSASCPVLTIGPKIHDAANWKLQRILCPVDVAEDPEPVLHYALSLAEENQAQVILLEAIPLVPWQHRPSVAERSRRALEGLIPEQAQDWCAIDYAIRWEHPAEAILLEARNREADLIVMSVHKSHAAAWSSHLPWPVASEVVSHAECPVLTVRV